MKTELPLVDHLFNITPKRELLMYTPNDVIWQNMIENYSEIISFITQYVTEDDFSKIKYLGHGDYCIAFRISESMVIKVGGIRQHVNQLTYNHRYLPVFDSLDIHNEKSTLHFFIDIQPYVETKDITENDVDKLRKELLSQGILWLDTLKRNVGLLPEKLISQLKLFYVKAPKSFWDRPLVLLDLGGVWDKGQRPWDYFQEKEDEFMLV